MGGGRYGGYSAGRERDMRQVNKNIKKAAKAAKRGKWLDRKLRRRSKPKRTLKDYAPDD